MSEKRIMPRTAWYPGCPSPNPGGRPRTKDGLAHAARRLADPEDIIRAALHVHAMQPYFRAENSQTGDAATFLKRSDVPKEWTVTAVVWPKIEHAEHAREFIADRAWAKPAQGIELSLASEERAAPDYTLLTLDQLDQLVALHDAATRGEQGRAQPRLTEACDNSKVCEPRPFDEPLAGTEPSQSSSPPESAPSSGSSTT